MPVFFFFHEWIAFVLYAWLINRLCRVSMGCRQVGTFTLYSPHAYCRFTATRGRVKGVNIKAGVHVWLLWGVIWRMHGEVLAANQNTQLIGWTVLWRVKGKERGLWWWGALFHGLSGGCVVLCTQLQSLAVCVMCICGLGLSWPSSSCCFNWD